MLDKPVFLAVVGVLVSGVSTVQATPAGLPAGKIASVRYAARAQSVTFSFDTTSVHGMGFRFVGHGQTGEATAQARGTFTFESDASSTFEIEVENGVFSRIVEGSVQTRGALLLDAPGERIVIGNLVIEVDSYGHLVVKSTLDGYAQAQTTFRLESIMLDLDVHTRSLRLIGELAIAKSWAIALGMRTAAGKVIGTLVMEARLEPLDETADAAASPQLSGEREAGGRSVEGGVPDVLVADLQTVECYGSEGGITACAVGTIACNIGSARASWVAFTNQHPVIAQNAYRLMNDRFEQIGMSWIKHGFFAVSMSLCDTCEDDADGSELGVGCSDPYSASLNGIQSNMSPRSTVNADTGDFPYPWPGWSGPDPETLIERRLQIYNTDLDPALNPGARYFVQGHYVTPGDSFARTHNNNASYREAVAVTLPSGEFTLWAKQVADTQRGQPAVRAWQDVDPSVHEADIQTPGEGLFILASKVIDLGTGVWRYEYALQNLNSDRSGGSFTVRLPDRAYVTNIGFNDVDYHSGEPYALTDWEVVQDSGSITWATESFEVNNNANALRWGTVYNFRFDVNAPDTLTTVSIGLFKPEAGEPDSIDAESRAPSLAMIDCNANNVPDACDLSCAAGCSAPCGTYDDCDGNRVPDECQPDCNGNGKPDTCDVAGGTSIDCNGNSLPDECEPDEDCNTNGVQDICDIAAGNVEDCNDNSVPDGCEPYEDCNGNSVQDICDIAAGTTRDCNHNQIPDQCEPYADCNDNFIRDFCDVTSGTSADCNDNGVPDECDPQEDCNTNGVQDICDIGAATSADCNANDIPDECEPDEDCNTNQIQDICDIASGASSDCNANNTPDECEPYADCNTNGVQDLCDIVAGTSQDCNLDGRPDECDISSDPNADCNGNGMLDVCEIDQASTASGGPFFCTADCDPDCDNNGTPDECDAFPDTDGDRLHDCDDMCPLTNPMVTCVCNEKEDCCYPGWCYSSFGWLPIPPAVCEANGGTPACSPSPLCRSGCLFGDLDDNGRIDLKDFAGMQRCFGIEVSDNSYVDCVRVFDYNEDGMIDLEDYETLEGLLSNGVL